LDVTSVTQCKPLVFAVHQPSMLQDIQAHRKTEIESINGAVVRFARGSGVPVPVTETLCHLVRMIE
jgi:2-dehydropantoate 2-reductase